MTKYCSLKKLGVIERLKNNMLSNITAIIVEILQNVIGE